MAALKSAGEHVLSGLANVTEHGEGRSVGRAEVGFAACSGFSVAQRLSFLRHATWRDTFPGLAPEQFVRVVGPSLPC